MSSVSPAAPRLAPRPLRHRRSARRMTVSQQQDLRRAISEAQAIGDDRGYQRWAGIHGLPLPISCVHDDELFLPWHRAYLYFFEKALQDRVPGVTLPWWDWTNHTEGVPGPYARKNVDGKKNPLYDSPIQPSGRANPRQTRTSREPGDPDELPSKAAIDRILEEEDYLSFQGKIESIHGGVHLWTGGTMGSVPTAAYDPLFWAHHCMIDRLWYLWQLHNKGAGVPASQLDQALAPFPMTVRQTLEITQLGYDYAASTAAAKGPGRG